jgi:hypothetical protein
VQKSRILVTVIAGVSAGALLLTAVPIDVPQAYAQKAGETKKKGEKKGAPAAAHKDEPRAAFTFAELEAATVLGRPDTRAMSDSETDFARLLSPQASGPWLAISGGGADGAFGAGALIGWAGRPEFSVVTGVSIGSLIAPYVFLGSAYNEDLRKNFTTITAADIFEDRVTRDSLFDYWPLKQMIERRVTPKMLTDIAAEHKRGRRLLVATTSLDTGRRVIWNMGAIAEQGGEKGLKLFREILLASCSIPGFFSPVAIESDSGGKKLQEMHGDGTLTAPFFVVPESMLSAKSTARPPFNQLYVLVNSKLIPDFKLADRSVAGVLGRSIDLALSAALRAEMMIIYAGAQKHGIGLSVAQLDPSFDFPSRGPFDGKYMQALFDYGMEQGKKGTAFADALPDVSLRGSNERR